MQESFDDEADGVTDGPLPADVLEQVPRGALAVAATAVFLLMVGWFFLYLVIFLPRGTVG